MEKQLAEYRTWAKETVDLIVQNPKLALYASSFFIAAAALIFKFLNTAQKQNSTRTQEPEKQAAGTSRGKVVARKPGGMRSFIK